MIILLIEILIIIVLGMILSTVIIDEKNHRSRNMRTVKLKGYWDGSERRSVERLNVSLDIKYFTNGKPIGVQSADISARGVRLLLDEKIGKGTPLRLEIKLPDEERIVKAQGVAVWAEEALEEDNNSQKRLFNTGIKFLRFQDSDEKRLFDFIHNLKTQKIQ
jgi:c-di-GMP-binding flagellar brake protein YcgR